MDGKYILAHRSEVGSNSLFSFEFPQNMMGTRSGNLYLVSFFGKLDLFGEQNASAGGAFVRSSIISITIDSQNTLYDIDECVIFSTDGTSGITIGTISIAMPSSNEAYLQIDITPGSVNTSYEFEGRAELYGIYY